MNSSVRKQRDKEMTNLFLSVLGDGRPANKLMAQVADMPCSRFWIEPEQAIKLIWLRRRKAWHKTEGKGRHAVKNANSLARIDEIMRRCDGDYSFSKVAEVVLQPAPSFYVSPRTAQAIITRTLKERRNK